MIGIRSAAALAALCAPARPRTIRKPPRRQEATLLRQCLQLLRLRNIWHQRCNVVCRIGPGGRPIRGNPAGTADVLLCIKGQLIALEVKSPAGRLRASQAAWRDGLLAAGGLYWEIRSLDELINLLKGQGAL